VKDFKAAAAALALERVRRIGNQLEFVQNEARNAKGAVEEMCFANIADASVDERTSIDEFAGAACGPRWGFDILGQGKFTEGQTFGGTDDESEISKTEK
jgi:hypothetical protein